MSTTKNKDSIMWLNEYSTASVENSELISVTAAKKQ